MSRFTITVVNKYREPNHIYCGRGSVLGNPFYMNGEDQRENVCDKYHEYFHQKVKEEDLSFLKSLRMIWDVGVATSHVNLGCFCAPRRCHCETIKAYLEKYMP